MTEHWLQSHSPPQQPSALASWCFQGTHLHACCSVQGHLLAFTSPIFLVVPDSSSSVLMWCVLSFQGNLLACPNGDLAYLDFGMMSAAPENARYAIVSL